jgi:hypothetical protein
MRLEYWLTSVEAGDVYSCRLVEGGEILLVAVVDGEWSTTRSGFEGVSCLEVRARRGPETHWVPRHLFTEFVWSQSLMD